jgi:hypothetical protein
MIIKIMKLKEYITSRIHDDEFITSIDFSLINKYNDKIDECERLSDKYKIFLKICKSAIKL